LKVENSNLNNANYLNLDDDDHKIIKKAIIWKRCQKNESKSQFRCPFLDCDSKLFSQIGNLINHIKSLKHVSPSN